MISLYILDAEIDKEITKERVKEFKSILLHYIDFQQKQKVIHGEKTRCHSSFYTPIPHRAQITRIDKYLDLWLNRT